jgi:hypothetical protein
LTLSSGSGGAADVVPTAGGFVLSLPDGPAFFRCSLI